ncbi:MAG: DUF4430 domain-containing protein [Bacteroidales bacterium]|nr:DUF4430 domain-containing protein [Lachnoclostridium sp.]MCM1383871.1 DUF4430 domain-containing protein [Lachnoclostridium sp.]MCM1464476.1 DUF4430 domain-containing protein [Bacteroidales bacterium]
MNKETQTEAGQSDNTANSKSDRKKILPAVLILAALALVFGIVYACFAPKPTAGTKVISVEVVDDNAASKIYTTRTDAEYLRQALEETEGLSIEGTESAYGLMVTTVNGLTADYNTDGAYWAFYVDGEYCNYGVDEQPIEDGQAYLIIYTLAE